MYFPYLRGRQNELLCLRELLQEDKLYEKVIPIIEPVRFNSTFLTTVQKFIDANRKIVIIRNPKVGSFEEDLKIFQKNITDQTDIAKQEKLEKILADYKSMLREPNVISAYLCNKKIISDCINGDLTVGDKVLINLSNETFYSYEDYQDKLVAKYTLIPNNDFKEVVESDAVILEDVFNKAKRNTDYLISPDEIFSRRHLNYSQNGYVGFSDYSIVGDSYEETGFAPLAVAIHILYIGEKKELRVHHFVSESNENISDPGRKFAEAMKKLEEWPKYNSIPETLGLEKLMNFYKTGRFPGLGVVKKCSLMHHLELIGKELEGEN
ncbi:MAG: sce7725 family protein [Fusobacterium periodonticum]|nr:sce7725 family protein [Fusobacterium periodonticum]